MTEHERCELSVLTSRYSNTCHGAWLNEFNWISIPVNWDSMCNERTGVLGYHKAFNEHIGLMECGEVKSIWPSYIHELWHALQYRKAPVRYFIFRLPWLRYKIERSAIAAGDHAEAWLEQNR